MRLITANLFNGRADAGALASILGDCRPDVVAGQEVASTAAEVLRGGFRFGLINPRSDCNGRALVSRQEILVEELELPARPALVAAVSLEGRPILLVSVHLSNPIDGRRAIHDRRRQVDGVLERIEGVERVVVVGDFNATRGWTTYRRLRSHLDDGVAAWAGRNSVAPPLTWGPLAKGPALLRIDHVMTRGVRLGSVSALRLPGSDHRALMVELEPV